MGDHATKLCDRLRDWGRDRLNVLELKELIDIVGPAVVGLERQLGNERSKHPVWGKGRPPQGANWTDYDRIRRGKISRGINPNDGFGW